MPGSARRQRLTPPPGYDYTAQIAGPITYWNADNERQSVVKAQGSRSDEGLFWGNDSGERIMSSINGKDYTKYLESEVKAKISAPLAMLPATKGYEVGVAVGVANDDPEYFIKKYNNTEQYRLTFNEDSKTFTRKTNYTDVNGINVSAR